MAEAEVLPPWVVQNMFDPLLVHGPDIFCTTQGGKTSASAILFAAAIRVE